VVNVPYELLNKGLDIPHGTLLSRYLQIVSAFVTSGLIHHAGALNDPFTTWSLSKWQVIYFSIQSLGIMTEDLAIHIGKQYFGLKATRKLTNTLPPLS
jgi:hypothetical protein